MPADRSTQNNCRTSIFCTACKTIKEMDEFDGNQFSKRFGVKYNPDAEEQEEKKIPMSYDPEAEKKRAMERRSGVKKMWCRKCVPPLTSEFYCGDCEQNLPRVVHIFLELSKHVLDEDRLCRDCADLTMKKVEAVRVGEEFEADELENKLKERRVANLNTSDSNLPGQSE
ncbi:hypothetical protein PSTT_03766 [Puccinia striiformis]|uniref:Stc1 domain-containing protein n=1 Tax=Puccinia striiformis TaxID=27350 RepID=A0A2S4VV23_9BASI|nr:hypothetical protein PSTT_03766 [Puccinia striiformis]